MKKKVFAFILAFALVISFSACGGKTETTSAEDSSASTSSTVEKDENTENKTNADSSGTDVGNDDTPSAAGQSDKDNSGSSANSYQPNAGNASVNNPSANNTSSSSGNSGNAGSNKPTHQHSWKTEYKTVHHDAQYKDEPVYENRPVYEERPVYQWRAYWTCNKCGTRFNNEDTCAEHCIFDCGSGWTAHKEQVQTGTEKVQVGTERVQTGTNRVKVKDAWDEKVAAGQVCTVCGAKK